jgi:PEP-CTERM motif
LLEVGIPGPAGFSIIFDGPDPIITYLPASGIPAPLTADLLNPVDTPTGALVGEVVTATLNVTFSDYNLLAHPAGVFFGDLVLQNLDSLAGVGPEVAALDGMSVREVLAEANPLLDGGVNPVTPQDMFVLLNAIDMSFNGGPVSDFAMEHLAFPATTLTVPEPSTWVMMLIGFAGLGFAGYRASRRPQPPHKKGTARWLARKAPRGGFLRGTLTSAVAGGWWGARLDLNGAPVCLFRLS